jgi:transposase
MKVTLELKIILDYDYKTINNMEYEDKEELKDRILFFFEEHLCIDNHIEYLYEEMKKSNDKKCCYSCNKSEVKVLKIDDWEIIE